MQSKASSVEAYLAELPEDRRTAIEVVRKVIQDNLDPTYAEGMTYGMIGYFVPHAVYPNGYHCDPKQPLPYVNLASQKGHMSLYMMALYMDKDLTAWFEEAWEKSGKKLDKGKSCVRFKKLADLDLDIIGEAIRRVPAKAYIEVYEQNLPPSKKKTK